MAALRAKQVHTNIHRQIDRLPSICSAPPSSDDPASADLGKRCRRLTVCGGGYRRLVPSGGHVSTCRAIVKPP